ncbi:hypothetical protein AHAS_Ahas14G0106400 [Arachis hypogaea]
MLDQNPRLNLASFMTTWMEPKRDKLIMAAINKNYVNMDKKVGGGTQMVPLTGLEEYLVRR